MSKQINASTIVYFYFLKYKQSGLFDRRPGAPDRPNVSALRLNRLVISQLASAVGYLLFGRRSGTPNRDQIRTNWTRTGQTHIIIYIKKNRNWFCELGEYGQHEPRDAKRANDETNYQRSGKKNTFLFISPYTEDEIKLFVSFSIYTKYNCFAHIDSPPC